MGHFQVGSSIGNGHPIGAVIATKEIAKSMDGYYSTFGGNPVACTMGTAVLRVLINERLLAAANNVGFILESLFKSIKVSLHSVLLRNQFVEFYTKIVLVLFTR